MKVLSGPDGARFDADARELWRVGADGRLPFSVAEPRGHDPVTNAVWQGLVAGRPVYDDLLGHEAPRLCSRLGAGLGSLAVSGVVPSTRTNAADQLARTARQVDGALRRLPGVASELTEMSRRLGILHDRLGEQPGVPVHGAPHIHQWLDDDGRLGLVDFDRFAFGSSELDLATFLAEVDYLGRLTVGVDEIERSLVSGFEQTGPRVDVGWLAVYRAHKRVTKVTRSAWALRPDGDARAARHLSKAMDALGRAEATVA